MKAEVKGTHTCRMHSGNRPLLVLRFLKAGLKVQIKERMNNSELREDQETVDACPRISKRPAALQAVLSLD